MNCLSKRNQRPAPWQRITSGPGGHRRGINARCVMLLPSLQSLASSISEARNFLHRRCSLCPSHSSCSAQLVVLVRKEFCKSNIQRQLLRSTSYSDDEPLNVTRFTSVNGFLQKVCAGC